MISHHFKTFGVNWVSILNKEICNEVIEFQKVSNTVIEIWIKHLYKEMDDGMDAMPIQFGLIAKLDPTYYTFPKRCSYISELLDSIQLAQVLVAIDMVRRKVYYLDSLGDEPDAELKQMWDSNASVEDSKKEDFAMGLCHCHVHYCR